MKNKIPKFFCILLVVLSVLFALIIFVAQPKSSIYKCAYKESSDKEESSLSFPIVQRFKVEGNGFNKVTIYLYDQSINENIYEVKIFDENNKKIYSHVYNNYNSDIIELLFKEIKDSDNKEYRIEINCAGTKCNNFNAETVFAKTKKYSIEGTNDKSLYLMYSTTKLNKTYYWYSIMGLLIAITLYPLTKEDKNEK